MQHVLLPAIKGTGTHVITMDNLDGHSSAVHFIKAAGHYIGKRQHRSGMGFQLFGSLSSSPSITCPQDLHEAAFDCVTCTPQDVAGCIAKAHFCVVDHIFEPYMGQQ